MNLSSKIDSTSKLMVRYICVKNGNVLNTKVTSSNQAAESPDICFQMLTSRNEKLPEKENMVVKHSHSTNRPQCGNHTQRVGPRTQADWPRAAADAVPFDSWPTESLQGSPSSLEEELPGAEHPLEPLLQDLWPGHLSARQQRQRQVRDEEGAAAVSAAAVRQARDEERQGQSPSCSPTPGPTGTGTGLLSNQYFWPSVDVENKIIPPSTRNMKGHMKTRFKR